MMYGNEPLSPKVVKAILKQAGISEEEFLKSMNEDENE